MSLFGFLPTPPSSMPLSFCVSQVIPQRSGFRTLLLLHVLPKMGLLLASLKGGATQKKFANGQARCRYCGNSIHLPMVSKNSLTPQEGLGHTEESERDQGEWKSSIVSWGGCVWDGWGPTQSKCGSRWASRSRRKGHTEECCSFNPFCGLQEIPPQWRRLRVLFYSNLFEVAVRNWICVHRKSLESLELNLICNYETFGKLHAWCINLTTHRDRL